MCKTCTAERYADIYRRFVAGETVKEIAAALGVSLWTVSNGIARHRSRNGLERPPLGRRPAVGSAIDRRPVDERDDIGDAAPLERDRAVDPNRCPRCHLLLPCDPCPAKEGAASLAYRRNGPHFSETMAPDLRGAWKGQGGKKRRTA